ncbi:methyl-accepting chemotaxis protein [Sporosarcina globispora]|uniref:HAMP domain-containing protein n=1 Tax=Sporosarcina globispora TaxID=1459 RepID=UPI0009E9B7D7
MLWQSHILLAEWISRPINLASAAIDRLAGGDLGQREIKVKNRDELGNFISSLNKMVIDLRSVVSLVRSTSDQVASSSEGLGCECRAKFFSFRTGCSYFAKKCFWH